LTEIYRDVGTYVKSFYTVMFVPSAVKVGQLRDNRSNRRARIHHTIDWSHCVAQIVPERYRKADVVEAV